MNRAGGGGDEVMGAEGKKRLQPRSFISWRALAAPAAAGQWTRGASLRRAAAKLAANELPR